MIDKAALLVWLHDHADMHSMPLVGALYLGLAERIARGDFDTREEERS